ncbi:MAG: type IV secretory system conjugative DNA transfer family protein [Methylococcaceae bacterium]
MVMKGTFDVLFKAGKYLVKGYVLNQEEGARFSNSKEEKAIFKGGNTGLLIDGKSKRLSEKDSFEHLAVIAKPGSGKTTGFIIPNILDKASQKSSMVITDPSGEIFQTTSGYLASRGYKILTINPDDLSKSCRFNPFAGLNASNIIEIEQICSSIVLSKYGNDKEGVWNDGAIGLLEVFAKCLAFSEPHNLNLPNINYLVQMFGENGSALDDWVVEHSINPEDIHDKSIVNAWIGITKNNRNMLTSYATIAKTALKQLNNRQIQKLLASNDLDFNRFRKEKTALYLIVPANQQGYYQFLIDVLYTRLFAVLMQRLPQGNDLSVYCFLDEFGSSYINDFQALINNIRKYRVSLSIVLQSISQLDSKYGKNAEAIKGGIGSYLILSGADYSTAKEISDIIGKRLLIQRNNLTDIEKHYHELTLLTPDQIRTLGNQQAVFLSKNRHPILVNITPFYQNFSYKSAVNKKPYVIPNNTARDTIRLTRL